MGYTVACRDIVTDLGPSVGNNVVESVLNEENTVPK